MLGFGFPERAQGLDFCHDLAGPNARFIDVGDRVLCNPALLIGRVEDRRPVACPDVVPLAIARGRIVNLEEELEDLPIADSSGIKDDLDCFSMSAMVAIGGIGCIAASVPNTRRENAIVAAKKALHPPKKTPDKHT